MSVGRGVRAVGLSRPALRNRHDCSTALCDRCRVSTATQHDGPAACKPASPALCSREPCRSTCCRLTAVALVLTVRLRFVPACLPVPACCGCGCYNQPHLLPTTPVPCPIPIACQRRLTLLCFLLMYEQRTSTPSVRPAATTTANCSLLHASCDTIYGATCRFVRFMHREAARVSVWAGMLLTALHLGLGVAARRAVLVLDVERLASAADAQDVSLVVALTVTAGTLGLCVCEVWGVSKGERFRSGLGQWHVHLYI